MEPLGKSCDGSVRTPELLQNATSGGVRERAERGIEVGLTILYHTVQYATWVTALLWEAERPLRCPGDGVSTSNRITPLKSQQIANRLQRSTKLF